MSKLHRVIVFGVVLTLDALAAIFVDMEPQQLMIMAFVSVGAAMWVTKK